jgi:hypothetical protein
MRDFKGMKRQRGRNRGGGSSGGKPQQQNANRAFDSNGPEGVKVRGNAQHVFEKYQQLARDAGSAGDRVLAENYLQHAEHYFRVVRAMQPQRPASEILGRDQFTSGFDIDFEDESGAQAQQIADAENANNPYNENAEGETEARSGGWRDDRPQRDDRQRDDRPRDRYRDDRQGGDRQASDRQGGDRQSGDRQSNDRSSGERQGGDRYRDDRQGGDRQGGDRQASDRPREDRQTSDRPRDDRPRDDRPRNFEGGGRRDRFRDRDDRPDRAERTDRDPLAVVEPQSTPLVAASEERASPVLRDETGGESRAPAFLKSTPRVKPESAPLPTAEETATEEGAKRPKRRRAPRTFEGGAAAPESEEV